VYGGVPPVAVAVNETDCPTAGFVGANVKSAVRAAVTETTFVTVVTCDAVSDTVRVTVKSAAETYVWLTLCPEPVAPSPNAQLNVYGGVPPVAVAENETDWPITGLGGENVKPAATTPLTVINFETATIRLAASVTVRVTVNVPAVEYAWFRFWPLAVPASPKFQLNVYGVDPPDAVAENETV